MVTTDAFISMLDGGWSVCPTCHGDGTTEPDPDTQTRPWCRTCGAKGTTS